MRRDRLVAAIRGRIDRVTSGPDGVLAYAGGFEAEALAEFALANRSDLEAAYLLGAWHWWRYHLVAEPDQGPERRAAVAWFSRVLPLKPELVPDGLHSIAARIAEPSGDDPASWIAEAARLMADPRTAGNRDVLDRVVRLLEGRGQEDPGRRPQPAWASVQFDRCTGAPL
jgi:hypothetical protein